MKKIKVLHIITRFSTGGARDAALAIIKGLDKNKFDLRLASGPQDFSQEIQGKWDIKVTIINDLVREINPVKDLAALVRLYFFIKRNKFDIVHTHTSKAGILGRIAAKLAGVPVLFNSPHGGMFHSIFCGPITMFLLSRLENFVTSFTDKVITCSDYGKRDYLRHKVADESKYITIYYGIKQDDFLKTYDKRLKRKQLNISDETILIGTIGRLVPQKGYLFCLEAFNMLLDRFPKAKFLIVGDGILKSDIEARINELNLNDNVIMTGHRNDIAEILAALDISLFTSIWEGAPIAIMEAMLMGKAIVTTDVAGIPELITNGVNGILVPFGEKQALVEAISRLIEDKVFAQKLGQAARQSAKKRFNVEELIERITKLYENFVDLKTR